MFVSGHRLTPGDHTNRNTALPWNDKGLARRQGEDLLENGRRDIDRVETVCPSCKLHLEQAEDLLDVRQGLGRFKRFQNLGIARHIEHDLVDEIVGSLGELPRVGGEILLD